MPTQRKLSQRGSVPSNAAILVLAGLTCVIVCPLVAAQSVPDAEPAPVALSERPFESTVGGIQFCYPLGSKAIRRIGKEDLVEFQDTSRRWSLVVSKQTYPQAQMLTAARDGRGVLQPGLMERTAAAIEEQIGAPPTGLAATEPATRPATQATQAGLKWLRRDLTNLGNYDVGMLAYRYTAEFERHFAQRAIIQASPRAYYLLALTTPARPETVIPLTPDGDEATEDPGERTAVETFRKIIDSVKLLDSEKIYKDQCDRLLHTRVLFYNWTQKNLMAALIPEQYYRLMREDTPGHYSDIGWRYVVEESERKGAQDGIRIGTHICFFDTGPGKVTPKNRRTDKEYWMSTTADRHHEDWHGQIVIDDGLEHNAAHPWPRLIELGTSNLKTSRFLLADPYDKNRPNDVYKQGTNEDPHQPWVGVKDAYTLLVQYSGEGTIGDLAPVSRSLAIFYLPQALDSMLPRLIPPNEIKSYMFYTYVSDAREVMLRYIEVKPEVTVQFGGQQIRAIPITDHVGYEGSITTHYLTRTGQYLGCECKDAKLAVVPTDKDALMRIWPDARFKAPGEQDAAPVFVAPRGKIEVGPDAPADQPDPPARVVPGRNGSGPVLPAPIIPGQ